MAASTPSHAASSSTPFPASPSKGVQAFESNGKLQSSASVSTSNAPPSRFVHVARKVPSVATTRWSAFRAKTVRKPSKSQQKPLNVRYRPVEVLDEDEKESDDEWQGLETASTPLVRSLLERERMTSILQSSWFFLLLLSTLTAITAWSVDAGVLVVTTLHHHVVELSGGWVSGYLLNLLVRVVILLLGVACTVMICPEAAGSGIPEMRSILGDFPFPNYLTGRALIAKCLGLIFALGSGLSIGKVGPFVHLSSIIAWQLLQLPLFKQIRQSKDLTHHVLAAACAVGVTATFGAPIGGVLFSIEVTTSYYVTSNYWRAFFSSVVGVVVFRALNSLLAGSYGSLFTTDFDALPYETFEIAFFLLLAVLCGLLAGLLIRSYCLIFTMKKRLEKHVLLPWCGTCPSLVPFIYAALVACLFALVEYPIGSFMQLTQRQTIDDMFSTKTLAAHDVATTTHLSVDFGSSWATPSLLLNLFVYLLVRFWSTVISITVCVPSGIVTPVFAIGAVIGRLFGEIVVVLSEGELSIGGYAVVGAASFTAGVTGTISIAVIVFELTGQLSYMIPVLLCVIVGRAVAQVHVYSLDLYETMARQKKLPQWPRLTQQISYSLSAGDLMRDVPPYYLVRHQTLASLKHLLDVSSCMEKGNPVRVFPVVDDVKTMVMLGVATRKELESLVGQWEFSLQSAAVSVAAGITLNEGNVLSNPATVTSDTVDLVHLQVLKFDDDYFHVPRETLASHVVLLISVHKCSQLFVTKQGKLQGVIHAADLLARSRRNIL